MRVVYKTDPGKRKAVNEDAVLVDEHAGLFLLADGMSWPCAGQVASDLAVRTAHAFLKERAHLARGGDEILDLLRSAVARAHEEVQGASKADPRLSGMGTTLLVLLVQGGRAYLGHVGDSRAYLMRGDLELITEDHTLAHQVENEVMIREFFFLRRTRVLTQALGPSRNLICDGHRIDLLRGDVILLCSDGLTDMLEDEAIAEILRHHRNDAGTAAESLVAAANRSGGADNISLALITI